MSSLWMKRLPVHVVKDQNMLLFVQVAIGVVKGGGGNLAKKKKKEPRVAAVDPVGILIRDLKSTALWVGVAVGVTVALAVIQRIIF
ncbi:hypothetical protein ACFO25_19365 [Paenactinomyces guangxiensis]|uniref:Uncharacterized protein n=1 Tax=Paenactinomyces guangxiensis TaxID=1490290 RepID=A0A7W1WSX5_9BACL|nr:hypothetical protein [Paenactinomyces guangxiensis]MBA4495471.1 hypothetical protein [Paenactinomyces guangxiensis]MBH8592406.1 hypothetical protein [Paenactinomyces guangxiensis]